MPRRRHPASALRDTCPACTTVPSAVAVTELPAGEASVRPVSKSGSRVMGDSCGPKTEMGTAVEGSTGERDGTAEGRKPPGSFAGRAARLRRKSSRTRARRARSDVAFSRAAASAAGVPGASPGKPGGSGVSITAATRARKSSSAARRPPRARARRPTDANAWAPRCAVSPTARRSAAWTMSETRRGAAKRPRAVAPPARSTNAANAIPPFGPISSDRLFLRGS